jgi:acyl carrier protein
VEDSAAVVDTTGSNVIIGAVTPASVDAAKVTSYAARCLPGFLEPKDVIAVDVIPRKGDGSCDAQALLTLWKGQKSARGGGAPLTPVETAVVKAWADTLGVDARTVSAEDDFFQVGGSSIVAGQFASDVRRALGANLTGADIFRYRTVAAIAAKIEKERAEAGDGGDKNKKGGLPPSMASKPLGSMAWTYHFSPTSAPSLMLQSLPLLVFAPMQKILRWCIFLNMWSFCIHGLHPSIDFVHYVSNHTFISHVVRRRGRRPRERALPPPAAVRLFRRARCHRARLDDRVPADGVRVQVVRARAPQARPAPALGAVLPALVAVQQGARGFRPGSVWNQRRDVPRVPAADGRAHRQGRQDWAPRAHRRL